VTFGLAASIREELRAEPAATSPAEHAPRHADAVSGPPPASGTPADEDASQRRRETTTATDEEGSR